MRKFVGRIQIQYSLIFRNTDGVHEQLKIRIYLKISKKYMVSATRRIRITCRAFTLCIFKVKMVHDGKWHSHSICLCVHTSPKFQTQVSRYRQKKDLPFIILIEKVVRKPKNRNWLLQRWTDYPGRISMVNFLFFISHSSLAMLYEQKAGVSVSVQRGWQR